MLCLGIATHIVLSGVTGIPTALAGMLIPLMIFIPLYSLKIMGAGDVKLLAAVGTFVGLGGIASMVALTMLLGGVLGLVQIVMNRIVYFAPYLARYYYPDETARKYVPYGIAIAAGGVLCNFYSVVALPI